MTNEEMVITVQTLVDNDVTATTQVVNVYLALAESRILQRLYPYNTQTGETEVPEKYHMLKCELAARQFLRRGAEGETSHNEDGVSRVYGSADDADILNRVVPYAKVV